MGKHFNSYNHIRYFLYQFREYSMIHLIVFIRMSNLKEKLIVGKYVFEIKEIHKDFTVKSRKLLKVILRKIPIHSITEEDCYNLLNFIHPNVQRVYNYKHDSTFHYFAAEYGSNLKDYLKSENNISIDNRINIVQQSTQGLNYLHNKNIFHGNICLENIFVVGDKVKLANFGPLTDLKQPDEIRVILLYLSLKLLNFIFHNVFSTIKHLLWIHLATTF